MSNKVDISIYVGVGILVVGVSLLFVKNPRYCKIGIIAIICGLITIIAGVFLLHFTETYSKIFSSPMNRKFKTQRGPVRAKDDDDDDKYTRHEYDRHKRRHNFNSQKYSPFY